MESYPIRSGLAGYSRSVTLASHVKIIVIALAALMLAGCGSAFKTVQTWEGPDAEPSQIATLDTPSQINVLSVNGRKMSNFLLEDLALTYELLPGENTVVFTYSSIWANSSATEDESSKVNKVTSARQKVVIDARAGENYKIETSKPGAQQEAKRLAANLQATIVNSQGSQVASATAYTAPKPKLPTLQSSTDHSASTTTEPAEPAKPRRTEKKMTSEPPAASQSPSATENDQPTLETMKKLWKRASPEDKKEFLGWAL